LIKDEKARRISSGGSLSTFTPMSLIFFGPPGTSKTVLAQRIADAVQWPLLPVNPSAFVKNGIEGVYAEAERVFGMLAILERVVVLLDEFDEMVRERGSAASD
jgi:AAA+ superfamily predicted ATPase